MAIQESVIIFAAASNKGGLARPAYPARDDRVICVNATTGNGKPLSDNPIPPIPGKGFATLGAEVLSAWPCAVAMESDKDRGFKRSSGTSQATIILASTATLLLELLRQDSDKPRNIWASNYIHSWTGMKLVLGDMSKGKYIEGFQYIDPSQYLDGSLVETEELEFERYSTTVRIFNALRQEFWYDSNRLSQGRYSKLLSASVDLLTGAAFAVEAVLDTLKRLKKNRSTEGRSDVAVDALLIQCDDIANALGDLYERCQVQPRSANKAFRESRHVTETIPKIQIDLGLVKKTIEPSDSDSLITSDLEAGDLWTERKKYSSSSLRLGDIEQSLRAMLKPLQE